ncbi:MAG: hypothetical protein ACYDH3_01380, partial [Candidatus Aminicenantales bacterium]
MRRPASVLGIGLAVVLSLAGLAGFILLFFREMNVYWFILAPVIFAVYQIPAVVVFALWKKKYGKKPESGGDARKESGGESP